MAVVKQIVPTKEWTHTKRRKLEAWRDGPWLTEPDKAQWQYNPYIACMLKRNPMGAWCGYAGVTPGHPLYQVDYDSAGDIDVHGGLTYSAMCDGDEEKGICHVAKGIDGEEVEAWWLGFDCAHALDAVPLLSVLPGFPKSSILSNGHYWTYEEVRAETERLAKQLIRMLPER